MCVGIGLFLGCGQKKEAASVPAGDISQPDDSTTVMTDSNVLPGDASGSTDGTPEADGNTNPPSDPDTFSPTDTTADGNSASDTSMDAEPCQPDCEDKVCGDDGCNGTCGDCDEGDICSNLWTCIPEGSLQCEEANFPLGGCANNPDLCVCLGCETDGKCEAENDDCVCSDCTDDPICTDPSNCNFNAICDPWLEGCGCADCFLHPLC